MTDAAGAISCGVDCARRVSRARLIALFAAVLLVLPACSSLPRVNVESGEYGRAREVLRGSLPSDRSDRNYMLARLSVGILDLADGKPEIAEDVFNETFDVLRTQGINADKTVASAVFTEGVRFWKGEPFEQAMAFHYIAVQKAMQGEWDNARAASNSSLFLLKDFGENERTGKRYSTLEIAQKAEQIDQRKGKGKGDDFIDRGYQPVRTDFALGYIMAGVSSLALGREDEARDNFTRALEVDAGLQPLIDRLKPGTFNTLLVVDAGRGPQKVQTGPYGALSAFQPIWRSDRAGLSVSTRGPADDAADSGTWPVVADINQMSQDHKWNNMEDVRLAKGTLGAALLAGGVILASDDDNGKDNSSTQAAGLILAGVGAYLLATSGADTRYCEMLPQRTYVVPLMIDAPNTTVRLDAGGNRGGMVLTGLAPPPPNNPIALRFVRLNFGPGAPQWALAGRVLYANDRTGPSGADGDALPYILGGTCVRTPSEEVLSYYQAAGNLTDFTLADLRELYRLEGIALTRTDPGFGGRHVLEGGVSLATPLEGTAGFARLFCQPHRAYRPNSERVEQLAEQFAERNVESRRGRSSAGSADGSSDRESRSHTRRTRSWFDRLIGKDLQ